ncbi:MAG TPA: hypothetical protein PK413_14795, partial [Thermoanaerobaculia bacterium]|nr:hypothetical protein [Thermoanaerobaculia bacterium]
MDGKKLDPNPPESGDLELRQALAGLAEAVRRRVRQHPGGHLLLERAGQLELPLKLPLLLRNGDLERLSKAASDLLDREVQRLVSERASFRPGHVFCLRCSRADCDHSSPHGSREVFTGYGPSGVPRFAELPAWLLEKQDPDVDLLYQPEASRFLTRVVSSSELEAALLPSFRSSESGLRLHGQVVAGWYRGSGADGHPIQLALSFQVVSLRLGRGSRRFGLNLVGVGADGESLERFCHRLGTVPWSQPVAWAQSILSSLSAAKKGQQGQHERRIEGLLAGLALRLE